MRGYRFEAEIHYTVEFMHIFTAEQCYIGMEVHVLKQRDGELTAVPHIDSTNYNRVMEMQGTEVAGRGCLVEKVSTDWFVAWRPFQPAPKLVPLNNGDDSDEDEE